MSTVETIYEGLGSVSPDGWLRRVLTALGACLPDSMNGVAYVYDRAGAPSEWRASRPIVDRAPEALADGVYESFVHAPAPFRRRLFDTMGPTGTFSATMRKTLQEQHEVGNRVAREHDVSDAIYVNAVEPGGRGVLLAFNFESTRRLTPLERRRLAMVSAHVGAARRLLPSLSRLGEPAAVFERDGRVAHVERQHEDSLDGLRKRLVELERVRRRGVPQDETLEAWKALVRGRFTLFDRFDSDGRRYSVAFVNPPGVEDPRGLTETEAAIAWWACRGHSQKVIAYELGISLGAVGALSSRVHQKLGVRSQTELMARLSEPSTHTRLRLDQDQELVMFSAPAVERTALDPLTDGERALARAVIAGKRNAEIAAERQTSERTVRNQLTAVYKKLEVSSRAELIARLRG